MYVTAVNIKYCSVVCFYVTSKQYSYCCKRFSHFHDSSALVSFWVLAFLILASCSVPDVLCKCSEHGWTGSVQFTYCTLFWPTGACVAGYRVAICFTGISHFLTISVSHLMSASTGRIFTRFSPFGSAMAVDDQSEPRFLIFQGTLP